MSEALLPGVLIALPILASTLPLLAGLLRERVGWPIATAVLAVEAALASWLAAAVYVGGERVVHVLGGDTFGRKDVVVGGQETAGFAVGIELVADALSGLVVLLVAGVALAVLAVSRRSGPRGNAFYSGYLLLTGGLMGVSLTGDLFNLFVFLEIVGLTTYALVASDRAAESAVAALKYLVIGTAGASLYLIGVGYLFVRTGTLNMVDVSRSLAGEPPWIEGALYADPLVVAGFVFVALGLATKAAIYPLHTWQPDAYAAAPDAVTVYISALVSTTAAYALARVSWFVFGPEFFAANPVAVDALLGMAAVSVVAGSLLAATQVRVKRTFAYSSVAQFGLVVVAVGVAVHPAAGEAATRFAVYGLVVHLIGHAVVKGGLFATAGALAAATGARRVDEYAGLARRRPFLAASVAVLGFTLVGVPPTVGFVGKWYIALGAVEAGLWTLVAVVVVSTLLTLTYVGRLVERLYFTDPAHASDATPDSGGGSVVADGGGDGSGDGPDSRGDRPDSRGDVLGGGDDPGTGVPYGMLGVALLGAALAVALGVAAGDVTAALDPLVDAVVEGSPEVAP